mmetsp:Transcript_38901/g.117502  ORF Transcript_38901/g.117502 Transcript_38901/m.117502 type:complete len:221 (-) Transcript_38901:479-1141(-)
MSHSGTSVSDVTSPCVRRRLASATTFATKASWMSSWTKMRLDATQHWPMLRKSPMWHEVAAWSRSASLQMIIGDFPPSSKVTRFMFVSLDAWTILWPTTLLPVNATLRMPGCLAMKSPVVGPWPLTMLTTPAGKPASLIKSHMRRPERGVFSLSFMTTVQPTASAGPSFHACISKGKFQGMIWPTTPTGCFHVKQKVLLVFCVGCTTLPPILSAWPAKYL